MSVSVRMIIDLNIQHYRDLLKTETDASKRQTISKLLFEEEAKLGQSADRRARTSNVLYAILARISVQPLTPVRRIDENWFPR